MSQMTMAVYHLRIWPDRLVVVRYTSKHRCAIAIPVTVVVARKSRRFVVLLDDILTRSLSHELLSHPVRV